MDSLEHAHSTAVDEKHNVTAISDCPKYQNFLRVAESWRASMRHSENLQEPAEYYVIVREAAPFENFFGPKPESPILCVRNKGTDNYLRAYLIYIVSRQWNKDMRVAPVSVREFENVRKDSTFDWDDELMMNVLAMWMLVELYSYIHQPINEVALQVKDRLYEYNEDIGHEFQKDMDLDLDFEPFLNNGFLHYSWLGDGLPPSSVG